MRRLEMSSHGGFALRRNISRVLVLMYYQDNLRHRRLDSSLACHVVSDGNGSRVALERGALVAASVCDLATIDTLANQCPTETVADPAGVNDRVLVAGPFDLICMLARRDVGRQEGRHLGMIGRLTGIYCGVELEGSAQVVEGLVLAT